MYFLFSDIFSIISKSATYDKSIEVHVLTDSSEEIDDELCIKYLRELKDVPLKLLFIFTGTDSITSQNAKAIFLLFSGGYCNSPIEDIDHYASFEHHSELLPLVKQILSDRL